MLDNVSDEIEVLSLVLILAQLLHSLVWNLMLSCCLCKVVNVVYIIRDVENYRHESFHLLKKSTTELMAAIQLGIGQSITNLASRPKRDLLLQDFSIVETVSFPRSVFEFIKHEILDFMDRFYDYTN